MNTPFRIGGFVAILAVIFGAAYGVGMAFDDEPPVYRLALSAKTAGVGTQSISFRIEKDGDPVTDFDVRHEKKLHLIAVRDDFSGFQHVHPTMAADGTWSVDLAFRTGTWRLYGDYQPTGSTNQVSFADVTVPGPAEAGKKPEVTRTVTVDGYQVSLDGDLAAGGEGSMLELAVARGGKPVMLQPYLGAFGHLVVLREEDMEYLHVHPDESAATEPIPFHVEVPTAGRYYLYLDFQVDGVVRTATFAVDATKAAGEHDGMGGMDHGGH